MGRSADLVLAGGLVEPIAPRPASADAVAVTDGRISAVGTMAEVEGLIGPSTRVVRLNGETVLPGFQDAHNHAVYGGLMHTGCNLHDLPDEAAYLEAVRAWAEAHPELEWIVGDGWHYGTFSSPMPHRSALDRAVPDRPVYLTAYDGHSAWANTRALELAGIGPETADPEHGRFERDPDGMPTGMLVEDATAVVDRLVPKPSHATLVQALLDSQRQLHSWGITAWHDPAVNPEWLPAYREALADGRLTARVVAAQQWQPWGRDPEADPLPRLLADREASRSVGLRSDVVKFFLDGVFESQTAYVLEPYLEDGRPGANRSRPEYVQDELNTAVADLERHGFDCHFHAIGDAAVRQALDAVAAAREVNGPRDARHSIAHIELIDPVDIPRFAELGVAANMQPFWAHLDDETRDIQVPVIGPDRYDARYAFGDLFRARARLAIGSDWTVTTADPLQILEVAIRRIFPTRRDDPPWRPDQRLDLDTALAAATVGSAWVSRMETDSGTIEVGKRADLVVLDRDLRAIPDGLLADARVRLTFVAGETVYEG
ncbi:MAG TPA: amidohydrolase [Candidatus Limnocylindria bacterium]|nr:amidohydrolase [Candidatus Limnocylindria bacterium]